MMRYIIIRDIKSPGRQWSGEGIGIAAIPKNCFVDKVHPFETGVFVFTISEAEYDTYRAFGLFPEYNWTSSKNMVTKSHGVVSYVDVYNPVHYCVNDEKIMTRSKSKSCAIS